jgi:fructose-6-phosphate aldolase 1
MTAMFELYLDTANAQEVARLNAAMPVFGVTTNPSILAKEGKGLSTILPEIKEVLGEQARFHVQVVSTTTEAMVAEAVQLSQLPYDIVVKIPTTVIGLAAIKQLKAKKISILATAIYSAQQGFMAALCGADYLAPYVNRIDVLGANSVNIVSDLQLLINQHNLNCKLLPASFKNTRQVMDILRLGVNSITLPSDIAEQMMIHPSVQPAVDVFSQDWQDAFEGKLAYQS